MPKTIERRRMVTLDVTVSVSVIEESQEAAERLARSLLRRNNGAALTVSGIPFVIHLKPRKF